jgi:hypothetical protein
MIYVHSHMFFLPTPSVIDLCLVWTCPVSGLDDESLCKQKWVLASECFASVATLRRVSIKGMGSVAAAEEGGGGGLKRRRRWMLGGRAFVW